MHISYLPTFKDRFNRQLEYIAKDNKTAATNFRNELKNMIDSLKDMPMRCRKSIFFNDENIRDMIFKGYVITYRIKQDRLEVFGFTKYQENPMD